MGCEACFQIKELEKRTTEEALKGMHLINKTIVGLTVAAMSDHLRQSHCTCKGE